MLKIEGGYVNDPNDPGGETNLGITHATLTQARSAYPDWGLPASVRDLTVDQAKLVYRALFWNPLHLDDVQDRFVAMEVFDAAVNCGLGPATLQFQKALDYITGFQGALAVDGKMGPATIGLANDLIRKGLRLHLVACVNGEQYCFYKTLVANPSHWAAKYAAGWAKRALPMQELLDEEG